MQSLDFPSFTLCSWTLQGLLTSSTVSYRLKPNVCPKQELRCLHGRSGFCDKMWVYLRSNCEEEVFGKKPRKSRFSERQNQKNLCKSLHENSFFSLTSIDSADTSRVTWLPGLATLKNIFVSDISLSNDVQHQRGPSAPSDSDTASQIHEVNEHLFLNSEWPFDVRWSGYE